jgi:hypothetical protein
MTSRKLTNRPRHNDKIWVEARLFEDLQPNGYVLNIDWEERELLVKFLGNKTDFLKGSGDVEEYSFDQFEGCFHKEHDGIWMLYD